ncbi:MAG: hypothetical protein ACR2KW_04135 [Rubrobacter sp.]
MGTFDPARHGFGFRNPVGKRTGAAGAYGLRNWFSSLVYGRGLCFGMVVGSLRSYLRNEEVAHLPVSPGLLKYLKRLHLEQFRPVAVLKIVWFWVGSQSGVSPGDIRLPDAGAPSSDPHILCFGPVLNRSFLRCIRRAHAVVPYRIEESPDETRTGETRIYVYDPNHPKKRDRYVTLGPGGGFAYGGFSAKGGWGVFPVPLSAISRFGGRGRG